VTGVPSARALLAAVAELRAILFWRRLRARGEGFALIALFALAIPAALLFAALVGRGSFRAARGAGASAGASITVILFGVWQAWTALSLSLADRETLDLRRFLPYPVPAGRVFALGLATAALADPFSMVWLGALSGVFAGAALARPGGWLVPLAATLALFAVATVAFVALLQEIAARLSRSRHFRLVAALLALAGWGVLVAAFAAWSQDPVHALSTLRKAQWIALPAALASGAARALYARDLVAALPWLAALSAAAAASGFAAYRVALGTARAGGEGNVTIRRGGAAGVLSRFGPLLEKELRYLARHPVLRLYAVLLPVLAGVAGWRLRMRGGTGVEAELAAALPVLALAAYVHLVTQPFWLNAFAWDRGGARLLFLAPIPTPELLRAKNRAALAASTVLFALTGSVLVAAGGMPPPWALLGAAVLHVGMAPGLHALGNLTSVLNPRAAPFGVQRGGALPPLSALAGMAVVSAVAGLFAVPAVVAAWVGNPWLLPVGWCGTGILALIVYRSTLPRVARLLERKREVVLAEVCGDDA
jgi:ABC-2 type transport system permease protein